MIQDKHLIHFSKIDSGFGQRMCIYVYDVCYAGHVFEEPNLVFGSHHNAKSRQTRGLRFLHVTVWLNIEGCPSRHSLV